jgi:hypothetical protein
MISNLTLEEARSRLREIANNVEDRGCDMAAAELRQIASRLGIRGHNNHKGGGQKPRKRIVLRDSRYSTMGIS